VKLQPVSNQLRWGMNGNTPWTRDRLGQRGGKWFVINGDGSEVEYDQERDAREHVDNEHQPRGFVIISRDGEANSWMDRPYEDASSDHHATLGALWWWSVRGFFGMVKHDDPPDAIGIAHSAPRISVVTKVIKPGRRASLRS
jgi:hypothetical protein